MRLASGGNPFAPWRLGLARASTLKPQGGGPERRPPTSTAAASSVPGRGWRHGLRAASVCVPRVTVGKRLGESFALPPDVLAADRVINALDHRCEFDDVAGERQPVLLRLPPVGVLAFLEDAAPGHESARRLRPAVHSGARGSRLTVP